jgi:hypothetical protein
MRVSLERESYLSFALILAASGVFAESIKNWQAPSTWSPAKAHGVSAMDVTLPMPFIGLAPCRIVDTRGNGAPIQGGKFTGGSDVRSYSLPGICGIPGSVGAVSLNFTVVGPTGSGFLVSWPTGGAVPPVSTLNFNDGQTVANAAVVPTSVTGSITVNVSAPTHVIVDVNGYYYSIASGVNLANNDFFGVEGTYSAIGFGGGIVYGQNDTEPTGYGTAGVRGVYTGTQTRGAGVLGEATAGSGLSVGVYGTTYGDDFNGAGVYGTTGFTFTDTLTGFDAAGVRGEGRNGVMGVTGNGGRTGVIGITLTAAGLLNTYGALGSVFGPYGVYSWGDYGGTGAKYFIEPHPTDASKVIRYVALEGPESGTYFRGTAHASRGQAVITVPEDFRMVTDDDGLTVQLTPVGASANMWIVSEDLNQIVVRSSRDVTFHYMVNGVRRSFKDHRPIKEGAEEFMPLSAETRMPEGLAELQKQRLIANGTYNADGTPNLETARALGWARVWEERLGAQPTRSRPIDPQMQQMQRMQKK